MKLYMKQKVFSWSNRFIVWDEAGAECYRVEGEVFTLGHKLHIYDAVTGEEVAYIAEELMHWMHTFAVWQNEKLVTRIVQKFTWFRPRYILEGTDWEIEGDVWSHDYCITAGGRDVAAIRKEWFTWGDSYCLEADRADDALIALCIALTVDCVLARQSS